MAKASAVGKRSTISTATTFPLHCESQRRGARTSGRRLLVSGRSQPTGVSHEAIILDDGGGAHED
jgi:hypothetical protein